MKLPKLHSFFIPVMGTGFTIDTPIKAAKYGISSVISLVDDLLIEKMRKHYCKEYKKHYKPITNTNNDPRANRIKEYLNLVNDIVKKQIRDIKNQTFSKNTDLNRYFEILPDTSSIKQEYKTMQNNQDPNAKKNQQEHLKRYITPGSIDVNIMTKLDKDNYNNNEKLPPKYSDALSALRGYAESNLCSGIVFSAGLNKRLYSYIEKFDNFYHDLHGNVQKKIIIKVSDYRSALIQGKFLSKKGLWVSEFRIESGLNCGGHAFATKGHLIGPVLEEFKRKKGELVSILFNLYQNGISLKGKQPFQTPPSIRITVQGGITTAIENRFLHDYYNVDSTGWGTPFLLVPEVTSVDQATLDKLIAAKEDDVYMSHVSPLNVIFQNLRTSTSEIAKRIRQRKGEPGSPCPKGFLSKNNEFTEKPICTASRLYQKNKIEQLKSLHLPSLILENEIQKITDKSCICHELGGSALIKNGIEKSTTINAAICPGPNIAFFSNSYSLDEMIGHIYGKIDLLKNSDYSNMFITELKLYIDVFKQKVTQCMHTVTESEIQYIKCFYKNLLSGIEYYKNSLGNFFAQNEQHKKNITNDLTYYKNYLEKIVADNKNKVYVPNLAEVLTF